MALALNDRVQQQGTANTTVSFTLTSTVPGFQTFAVIGNGNTTYYAATDASYNWEVGIGTYSTTGPTLTRTTILSSSNSGSAETFVGDVNVFVTYPSEKSINYDADGIATIGELLGYADTGIISSFASTVAGYNQVVLQNKSTATNASSNFNVSNDAGTAGANYAELGINSSTFSNGAGCFNIPGAAYVASAGEDLSIGTYGPHQIHFATNSNTTDSMTIYDGGGISLGGYGDPGLGNIAVNKAVPGFTSITSAAGVTTLVAASTYYQRVVGTSTQTIQLPDATTLLNGTTFIIDNSSTQSVTITDGATTTIDTAVAGSLTYIYLINNSTLAGTWAKNHFLPSSYDFGATSANFGGATISDALWNGTTIGTAYGGTGLTTFAAANNALYSTSAGDLAAGTLPVAAGGTGATTLTGIPYANGTSPYTAATTAQALTLIGTVPIANGGTNSTDTATAGGVGYGTGTAHAYTAAGTAGQILTSAGASAPTWAANPPAFPSGTAMLFIQTSAPTGWTKSVTHDNKALRIVSGAASSGGSVAFTTAFASQSVSGSVAATAAQTATNQATTAGGSVAATAAATATNQATTAGGSVAATAAATATNQATTAGGSISVTVSAGTLAVGAGTFAVSATTISTAQMPAHTHTVGAGNNFGSGVSGQSSGGNANTTSSTGGGGSHTHTLSGAPTISGSPAVTGQTFTGTSHNHTQDAHSHTNGAFTGTSHNHTQDAHSHTNGAFTGTSHNHTQDAHSHTSGAFTGTAINLAVAYVDTIIATKD
jgi:hypothetical protein